MAIKILKLVSQEDIICDYEVMEDGSLSLLKPAKIMMFPTENGGMGMAIMPWVPFSDDPSITLKERSLLIEPMEPSIEMRNEYNQRFGSGIVTPKKGDLIL